MTQILHTHSIKSSDANPPEKKTFFLIILMDRTQYQQLEVNLIQVGRAAVQIYVTSYLTEVAGEGGTDSPPQNFLLSQQFRHLMRCTKHVNKICLSCLVPKIQLFVYIFGQNSKWPPEVPKGSLVKFFEVSYYQNFFSSLQFIEVKIEGYENAL